MRVELNCVSKSYKTKKIFDNFSAVIEPQKITCIYGASGTGKSTLLYIIGLLETYNGCIKYDGKIINSTKEKKSFLAKKIGFVFQNFGLVDNETVLDNFKLIKNYNSEKEWKFKLNSCLEKVDLHGMENKVVYELSGGEQQRVSIAKILFREPDLILADEPTASLDEENKEIVLKLFQKMSMEGKTIVIVTHDRDLMKIADQIINL